MTGAWSPGMEARGAHKYPQPRVGGFLQRRVHWQPHRAPTRGAAACSLGGRCLRSNPCPAGPVRRVGRSHPVPRPSLAGTARHRPPSRPLRPLPGNQPAGGAQRPARESFEVEGGGPDEQGQPTPHFLRGETWEPGCKAPLRAPGALGTPGRKGLSGERGARGAPEAATRECSSPAGSADAATFPLLGWPSPSWGCGFWGPGPGGHRAGAGPAASARTGQGLGAVAGAGAAGGDPEIEAESGQCGGCWRRATAAWGRGGKFLKTTPN